ncbi:MAG: hypothetical protein ACREUF_06850, partial [Solimonas sp.]
LPMLATIITLSSFDALIDAAFQAETPRVSASESDFGEPLQHFADAAAVKDKAAWCVRSGVRNHAFALWYPPMKGLVVERRVELDPPRDGKTFRYSLSGWGLIHLHLYFTPPDTLQCRVAVNSLTRARSREDRYPDLGPVSDWDWRVVETHAFRLGRTLAAMGKVAPVGQPAPAATPCEPAPDSGPWKRRK